MKSLCRYSLCAVVLLGTLCIYAQEPPVEQRGYIGVVLDPEPLPELLNKHLNLPAGTGLRIKNIQIDSPADKAGLEHDDIIVAVDNRDANDLEGFIQSISSQKIGTEVTLEIIHKGQRNTVSLTRVAFPEVFKPKYPPEPQVSISWRPGNVFHLDPNSNQWLMMPEATLPDMKTRMHKPLEVRTFHYLDGDNRYTVIIEGDPYENDTRVIVSSDQTQYQTMIGDLGTLPESFKEKAERAIFQARRQARRDNRSLLWKQHSQALKDYLQENPPNEYTQKILDNLRRYLDNPNPPQQTPGPLIERNPYRMQQLEERLRQLEQRLGELEKSGSQPRTNP